MRRALLMPAARLSHDSLRIAEMGVESRERVCQDNRPGSDNGFSTSGDVVACGRSRLGELVLEEIIVDSECPEGPVALSCADQVAGPNERANGEASQMLASVSVLLADSDPRLRCTRCKWLESINIAVVSCEPAECVECWKSAKPDCVVIGVGTTSQAELVRSLVAVDPLLPVICIASEAEISAIVELMRAGARDFLTAPLTPASLIDSIRHQVARRKILEEGGLQRPRKGKVSLLSPREREILDYVVRGFSTKQIAQAVGRVEKTIEFHRHNLMRKLGAANAAQLVRVAMLEGHGASEQETLKT
jgi:FixJ family two-component response regulator